MASSFHVILPSSVRSPTEVENTTNKFRVHLPRPLIFNDGVWLCGVTSIIFTNSWPSIGTLDQQYVDVYLKDGRRIRINVAKGSYPTPETLEAAIRQSITDEATSHIQRGRRPKRSSDNENSSLLHIAQRAVDIEKAQFALGLLRRANQSKSADTETTHYAWNGREFVAEARPRLPPGYRYVRRELWWERDGQTKWAYPYFDIENVADARLLEDAQKSLTEGSSVRLPLPATHQYVSTVEGDDTTYTIEALPPTDAEMLRWARVMLEVERDADFLFLANTAEHPRILREEFMPDKNRWKVDEELVPRPPLPRTHRYVQKTRTHNDFGEEFTSIEIEPMPPPENVETTQGVNAIVEYGDALREDAAEREPMTIDKEPSFAEVYTPGSSRGVVFTEQRLQETERGSPIVTASARGAHEETLESTPMSDHFFAEMHQDEEPPTKIGRTDVTLARTKPRYEELPPSAEDMDVSSIMRSINFVYLKGIARFQLVSADERVRFVSVSTQLAYSLGFEVHAKILPGDTAKYQCDLKVSGK